MIRIDKVRESQEDRIQRYMPMFADLLYGELLRMPFNDNVFDELAAHLNVDTEDVQKWLKAEALPCFELFDRMLSIFGGVDCEVDRKSGFYHIHELIKDIERAKILCNIELTQPKSG